MSWLACLVLPAVWAPVFCGVQLVFLVSEERYGGSVFSVVKHVKSNTVHSRTKHRLLEADLFSQGPTSNYVQNGMDQRWAPHPCVVPISFNGLKSVSARHIHSLTSREKHRLLPDQTCLKIFFVSLALHDESAFLQWKKCTRVTRGKP